MFGISQSASQKLTQKNDLKIEDLPIHTMKKDLWAIDNPALAQAEEEKNSSKISAKAVSLKETLTEKQKTSPFLRSEWQTETPAIIKPVSGPLSDKSIEQENKSSLPKPTDLEEKELFGKEKTDAKSPFFRRLTTLSLTTIIILATIYGGYYFWSTRKVSEPIAETSEVNVIETPESSTEEIKENLETKKPSTLNTQEANDWVMDFSSLDEKSFKEALLAKVESVKNEKLEQPVEFTIKDPQNNPISFSNFAKKARITLPASLINNVSGFSLFIYGDVNSRLGLKIDLKNIATAKKLIADYESKLTSGISSIFLAENYKIEKKNFQISQYKVYTVRFVNIIAPEELSVDYVFRGKEWVIGTTKSGLRSILDYLDNKDNLTKDTQPADKLEASPDPTQKADITLDELSTEKQPQ